MIFVINSYTLFSVSKLFGDKNLVNCTSRTHCPVGNKCFTFKIVYERDARNDTNNEKKLYLRVSETGFKNRFRNQEK